MEGKSNILGILCFIYYFKKGKNTTETQKKICVVYGKGAVTDWMCQKWFANFCAGNLLLDNAPWLGRPVEVDQIKILVKNIQCYILQEMENIFKISKSRVENNLYQFGYVSCCSDGKESACNVEDAGLIPGSGRSLGKGNGYSLQYSCLENPMDRGAWQATVCAVTTIQIWLSE